MAYVGDKVLVFCHFEILLYIGTYRKSQLKQPGRLYSSIRVGPLDWKETMKKEATEKLCDEP